jgi:CubicO group peptidase (beta-lactamase class C family)
MPFRPLRSSASLCLALLLAWLAAWPAAAAAQSTSAGHTYTLPTGFTLTQRDKLALIQPPEGDSTIAIVDVPAKDADEAVALAWAAARPQARRVLKLATPRAARNGWEEQRFYEYETSPNERAVVFALARRAGTDWLVLIVEASEPTYEKRSGPISQLFASLRPKGYTRESFAGRKPQALDAARIAAIKAFLADGMRQLDVPGVGFSLIDGQRVVFEGGLGVKALGRPAPVDARTLFMAASNTKSMTTLLMAQAVDAGHLRWDQPVAQAYPDFRLGDAEVTKQVLVKHLVCACTGMPRQDMEWIFQFAGASPASTFDTLGRMKPTSQFGEVFQYSNLMVSAAGYVAAAKLRPGKEVGAAYDQAMREMLFVPLGMNDTTFDFARAQRGNHARPHGDDLDGHTRAARMDLNYAMVPARPAGGVWTSARDMSRYVRMELARGKSPSGKAIVSEANLLARRQPQIMVSEDLSYGMGLFVDKQYGIEIVSHGGDMLGYHSNMIWLPEFGIGATILTNSDSGVRLRGPFLRKLLELVFDAKPEADEQLRLAAQNRRAEARKERERLLVPPAPDATARLAARYFNSDLGALAVLRAAGGQASFDFGEWASQVASRSNDDGSTSFVTVDPGVAGFNFVLDEKDGRRALILRDAQHEYLFTAAAAEAGRKVRPKVPTRVQSR